jgi:hypothetical protein
MAFLLFAVVAILSLSTLAIASLAALAMGPSLSAHSEALDRAHNAALPLSLDARQLAFYFGASAPVVASPVVASPVVASPVPARNPIGFRAPVRGRLSRTLWLADGPTLQNGEIGEREITIGGNAVLLVPAFGKGATERRKSWPALAA